MRPVRCVWSSDPEIAARAQAEAVANAVLTTWAARWQEPGHPHVWFATGPAGPEEALFTVTYLVADDALVAIALRTASPVDAQRYRRLREGALLCNAPVEPGDWEVEDDNEADQMPGG